MLEPYDLRGPVSRKNDEKGPIGSPQSYRPDFDSHPIRTLERNG